MGRTERARSRSPNSTACPATSREKDTTLKDGEIVVAVDLPENGFAKNYTYLKLRDRLSYAFALVSVAAALELEGDTIKTARLALGGVAHKPWRNRQAEAELAGKPATRETFAKVADLMWPRRSPNPATASRSNSPGVPSCAASNRPPRARPSRSATSASSEVTDMTIQISPAAGTDRHVGSPRSRVDGPAKVTGLAKYAAEFSAPGLTHGYVVTSTIARGRITGFDSSAAEAVPGVIKVLTHENRPDMSEDAKAYQDAVAPPGVPFRPLLDANVLFSGQPVAVVLAEDFETARYAASLVKVSYKAEAPKTDIDALVGEAYDRRPSATASSRRRIRGAMPTAPSTRHRSRSASSTGWRTSTITRWSRMPRPLWSRATTATPSTTRSRAW